MSLRELQWQAVHLGSWKLLSDLGPGGKAGGLGCIAAGCIVYTHATPIAEKMWDSAKQQIAVKQHTETKDTTVVQDNQ